MCLNAFRRRSLQAIVQAWRIKLFGIDQSGPTLLDSHGLRLASGFGISWKSPVGPVKIDFGVPLIKQPGDQTEVVRVNFGTRF